MSFNDTEISNFDAQPVALYEFYRISTGAVTNYWRYTSADKDQLYSGMDNYSAIAISDGGVTSDGNAVSSQFVVTMPNSATVPQLFRGVAFIPSDTVWLNLWRYYPDTGDRVLMWKGTVSGVVEKDAAISDVQCNSLAASFDRDGVRLGWTRNCPYATYSVSCTLDPADFTDVITVGTLTGNTLFFIGGSRPDDWFTGGYIEWIIDDGSTERREIMKHSAHLLTLSGPTFQLNVGDTLNAIAGDDRTRTTCNTKFNNLTNYGGFDLPGKSPFDGDPVF